MREWIGKHKAEAFGAAALAVIAAVCIIRMLQPVKVWEFGEDQLDINRFHVSVNSYKIGYPFVFQRTIG